MVNQRFSGMHLLLLLLDFLAVNLAYLLTLSYLVGFNIDNENFKAYIKMAPWILLISILVFYIFDLYVGLENKDFFNIIYSLFLSVTLSTVLIMGAIYLTQNFEMPRMVVIPTIGVEIILLGIIRFAALGIHKYLHGGKRLLLIGSNLQEIMILANKFAHHQGWFNICDYLENPDIEDLQNKAENSDLVVITDKVANKEQIIDYCVKKHKELLMVPDIFGILLYSSEAQLIDDTLMFAMKPPGLKVYQKLIKRAFDIIFSLCALIILSPVMLVVALLIYITSPGQVLFRQERLGVMGKPFQLIKFRTMVEDAEKDTGPVLASEDDPRITKTGAFLRGTRLDEMPQLINVLIGHMSIIGPRPEREYFVDKFSQCIPYYRYRMVVRPGITGLAQAMGKYSTLAEDKLRFDLMYIRKYSLLLDLRILLQTLRVILEGDKAAGVKEQAFGKLESYFGLKSM